MADESPGDGQNQSEKEPQSAEEQTMFEDVETIQHEPIAYSDETNKEAKQKRNVPALVQATFTVVAAIAACIYTYYASKQWEALENANKNTPSLIALAGKQASASERAAKAAEESARIARDALELSESPNIASAVVQLRSDETAVDVIFKNTGRGTARNLEAQVALGASLKLIADPFKIRPLTKPISKGNLDPSDEARVILPTPKSVAPEQFAMIKKGTAFMYVFGKAHYGDRFGCKYALEFCTQFDAANGRFPVCSRGDTYQRNCKKPN